MRPYLTYSGAVEHDPAIDLWLQRHTGDLGAIARDTFKLIRGCGPDVLERMHDMYATACVGDAPFAHVAVHKAHVNVGFYHGVWLDDPRGLLEGTGKSMRHVKLVPGRPVDAAALAALVRDAHRDIVARVRAGT